MDDKKINKVPIIEKEFLEKLTSFEQFFNKIGFKRIEGSIYGLLVLSETPLSSEDIEYTLGISQSAISNALKHLAFFGAIETNECRVRRCKLHTPKDDCLDVVASVFRKREQQNIEEFKSMAQDILSNMETDQGCDLEASERAKRLNSIISTCEIAESIMDTIIGLRNSPPNVKKHYVQMVTKMPQMLDVLSKSSDTFNTFANGMGANFANNLKNNVTGKIKDGISKITKEH